MEAELASELGVSRWPIRQAIARLEQEHLVVTYPNRGAFVVGLSTDDVHEIYALRRLLETYAAREAAKRVQAEHLDRLRRLVVQMVEQAGTGDLASFSEPDMAFHRSLFEIAGSKRLLEMWELLSAPVRPLLVIGAKSDPNLSHGVAQRHEAIIVALATGCPDATQAAVLDHLTQAETRALHFLEATNDS